MSATVIILATISQVMAFCVSYYLGRASMRTKVLNRLENTCSDKCRRCGEWTKGPKYVSEISIWDVHNE